MSTKKVVIVVTSFIFFLIIAINLYDFSWNSLNSEVILRQFPKKNKIHFLELGRKDIPNDYIVDVWAESSLYLLNNTKGIQVNWRTSPLNLISNSNQQSTLNFFLYAQGNTNHTKKVQFINVLNLEGNTIFEIPDEAGIYEAKYLLDSNSYSIANSGPILVQSNDIELEIEGTEKENKVKVRWGLPSENLRKKKSIHEKESTEIILCLNLLGAYDECLWSQILDNNTGFAHVDLPEFSGYFIFRIIQKQVTWRVDPQYKCLQATNAFKSTNSLYKLLNTQTQTVIASTLSLSWNVIQHRKFDWIGLFSLSSHNAFLRSETPLRIFQVNEKVGSLNTIIPPNSQAGPFVFVYYSNHLPVAVSDIITAHQPNVKCPKENSTKSKIKHLVIIVVENHTFDAYFGSYCKAKVNSDPSCNEGPQCCEKAPEMLEGAKRYDLTNKENLRWNPNHFMDCELCEINGRRMDGYIHGCFCSNPKNFAFADEKVVDIYYNFASNNSLADNYFQASAGATSQNNMYFARASFVFKDDSVGVLGSPGEGCDFFGQTLNFLTLYYDPSLTSLLDKCGKVLKTYAEGYEYANTHFRENPCWPNGFYSLDIPHIYYAGVTANSKYIADYTQLEIDLKNKTLADVVYIKPLGIRTGHPAASDITNEVDFVNRTVNMILESEYAEDTLILYTADESGGFYDHKTPPETSKVDNIPYGPRIPLLAIGKFAKKNYISHVQMEHSSVVKFVEFNWLNGETGQLNTRDKEVNHIFDMIDLDLSGLDN